MGKIKKQKLDIENKISRKAKATEKIRKSVVETENQKKNDHKYHTFISTLFAHEKQWKRYSEILTNKTKFDSNALKNKYLKNKQTPIGT